MDFNFKLLLEINYENIGIFKQIIRFKTRFYKSNLEKQLSEVAHEISIWSWPGILKNFLPRRLIWFSASVLNQHTESVLQLRIKCGREHCLYFVKNCTDHTKNSSLTFVEKSHESIRTIAGSLVNYWYLRRVTEKRR